MSPTSVVIPNVLTVAGMRGKNRIVVVAAIVHHTSSLAAESLGRDALERRGNTTVIAILGTSNKPAAVIRFHSFVSLSSLEYEST